MKGKNKTYLLFCRWGLTVLLTSALANWLIVNILIICMREIWKVISRDKFPVSPKPFGEHRSIYRNNMFFDDELPEAPLAPPPPKPMSTFSSNTTAAPTTLKGSRGRSASFDSIESFFASAASPDRPDQ